MSRATISPLSGLNVWQDVGFHVEEGASTRISRSRGANLINKPLPAGEYQFAVRASNGYRVTYKITVKPTEHLHLGYDGADLLGGGLHESDVPALRPDEAGRGAGGAGPRCRDGRRRPADVRFRRLRPRAATARAAARSLRRRRRSRLRASMPMWSRRVRRPPAEPGLSESEALPGCGLVFREATVLPALGHDMVNHTILARPARRTACSRSVCSRCELIGPLKSVPATGHDMKTAPSLPRPARLRAWSRKVCTHCGETGALTNLPALGHDYAAVVTEPTCETPSFTTHTCGRCGDRLPLTFIAPWATPTTAS